MIQFRNLIRLMVRKVTNSIAFYPALLALVWVLAALLSLRIEQTAFINYLRDHLPFLLVNDAATARTLLSTFIGGLLSLTVFSFSMVMILLNQASASYSPRLLPGLTTDKINQIVLGIYIGTIIYCIIILRNVQPDDVNFRLPGFSITLAIFSVLFCIALFVYFIHNISVKIRIENILDEIYQKNSKIISNLHTSQKQTQVQDLPGRPKHDILLDKESFGYYEDFNVEAIERLFKSKEPILMEFLPPKGSFVLPSQVVICSDRSLKAELKEDLVKAIHLGETPYGMTNFENGFQQISEIIVKAMSPGINDPGTAKDAIQILTKLLALRIKLADRWLEQLSEGQITVIRNIKSFEDLLFEIMAPIRQYCKKDISVVIKLINMLSYLRRHHSSTQEIQSIIEKEFDVLMEDVDEALESDRDRKVVIKMRELLGGGAEST